MHPDSCCWSCSRALALPLHGHGPAVFDEGAIEIEDPTVSWVVPGLFETGDEVFSLLLDFPDEGFAFPVAPLGVPGPGLAVRLTVTLGLEGLLAWTDRRSTPTGQPD